MYIYVLFLAHFPLFVVRRVCDVILAERLQESILYFFDSQHFHPIHFGYVLLNQ